MFQQFYTHFIWLWLPCLQLPQYALSTCYDFFHSAGRQELIVSPTGIKHKKKKNKVYALDMPQIVHRVPGTSNQRSYANRY